MTNTLRSRTLRERNDIVKRLAEPIEIVAGHRKHDIGSDRSHLSREQVDGQAMVVLGTDSVVSPELLDKLRKLPNMISVTELEM